ncbi:dipeptidase [Calderihabitans maritimus]|nr:dipeptidase [Calderihabitans maritimus]
MSESYARKAQRFSRQCFLVDTHCDTLGEIIKGKRTLGEESCLGHVDLPRLEKAGIDLQFFAAFVEPHYKPWGSLFRLMQLIDVFHRELEKNANKMGLILSAEDIHDLKDKNKIGALLAVEGGEALGGELGVLRLLFKLGVRSLGLTWNQRNEIADGIGEGGSAGGLSSFGRQVVKEMNRLGMLVDVSHLAIRGFWDVLEVSQDPVIASHSNCYSLCPHPRNLLDEQIKGLAEHGGVISITFAPQFLDQNEATVEKVLEHIEYACTLVGAEHVGIGSDFDGIDNTPKGLEDVTKLSLVIEGLLRRGFHWSEVQNIMGGNVLRILRQVLPKRNKQKDQGIT